MAPLRSRIWSFGRLGIAAGGLAALAVGAVALGQERGQERGPAVTDDPGWIHDDIETAYARAQETGKPLLVGFR